MDLGSKSPRIWGGNNQKGRKLRSEKPVTWGEKDLKDLGSERPII